MAADCPLKFAEGEGNDRGDSGKRGNRLDASQLGGELHGTTEEIIFSEDSPRRVVVFSFSFTRMSLK